MERFTLPFGTAGRLWPRGYAHCPSVGPGDPDHGPITWREAIDGVRLTVGRPTRQAAVETNITGGSTRRSRGAQAAAARHHEHLGHGRTHTFDLP